MRHIVSMAMSTRVAAAVFTLLITAGPIGAQQQAPVRVPASVLERYAGEYQQGSTTIRIRVDGDKLVREVPGQQVPLMPISETLFHMGPTFTVEFVTDPGGGVTQVVSNGIGVEFRLRRKGSPPEPPPASSATAAAAVRVPRSVLERYVGIYEFVPGQMSRTDLRVVIRLEGDSLIRDGGQLAAVLTPVSETRFRVGNTSAMVEFVVDDWGVMQILGSGFQQMLARRTSKS